MITFTDREQSDIDDMVSRILNGEMDRDLFVRATDHAAAQYRTDPTPTRHHELMARQIVEVRTKPAMVTPTTIPCPLGCGRQVSAEGDEIHYCVTKTKEGRKTVTHREYVGTFDGQAICYGNTQHDVEVPLRQYVEELGTSGMTRTATELDGGTPEEDEPTEDDILDKIFLPSELDEPEEVLACPTQPPHAECTYCGVAGVVFYADGQPFCVDRAACIDRVRGIVAALGAIPPPATMDEAVKLALSMRHIPLSDEARYGHGPVCMNCGGPHVGWRCPEIGKALMAPEKKAPTWNGEPIISTGAIDRWRAIGEVEQARIAALVNWHE